MKRAAIVLSILFLILATNALAEQSGEKSTQNVGALKVSSSGYNNDTGSAKIGICNSEESFNARKGFYVVSSDAIKNSKSEHTFGSLPYGTYVVMVYHDENDNNKLDSNFLGIPKEQYGYSNNARGSFGPPSFEKAGIVLDKPELNIMVTVE
jgi:uncharacterized protein (DUF2141 family)